MAKTKTSILIETKHIKILQFCTAILQVKGTTNAQTWMQRLLVLPMNAKQNKIMLKSELILYHTRKYLRLRKY